MKMTSSTSKRSSKKPSAKKAKEEKLEKESEERTEKLNNAISGVYEDREVTYPSTPNDKFVYYTTGEDSHVVLVRTDEDYIWMYMHYPDLKVINPKDISANEVPIWTGDCINVENLEKAEKFTVVKEKKEKKRKTKK